MPQCQRRLCLIIKFKIYNRSELIWCMDTTNVTDTNLLQSKQMLYLFRLAPWTKLQQCISHLTFNIAATNWKWAASLLHGTLAWHYSLISVTFTSSSWTKYFKYSTMHDVWAKCSGSDKLNVSKKWQLIESWRLQNLGRPLQLI